MCIETAKKIIDSTSAIILDVEGTTTSISFVKDELFPFAERFLEEFVKTNWNEDKIKEIIALLLEDQGKLENIEGFIPLPPVPTVETEIEEYKNRVVSHLKWQQSKDYKSTGLKKLQGYIWMKGYFDGTIKGHIYEDVPVALKYWNKIGKKIYIYSSGSIGAQKVLFKYSIFEDLHQFIDGNFDTTIGSKIESDSYFKIAKEISERPENIVFFTDRPKEVAAAKESGMKVVRMDRKENNPYLDEEKDFLGQEDVTLESFLPLVKI